MEQAPKDDKDKLMWHLLPIYPIQELIKVYHVGIKNYYENSWRKGLNYSRLFSAMMRHAWAWWSGETHDPKDGQHHLASVAWCALTLIEYERTHPKLDDRVKNG